MVPFVVVITTLLPRISLNSAGELPRSNPSRGMPPRSPARRRLGSWTFRARAASTVSTGKNRSTPCSRPVIIVEVARKTSNTTAVVSLRSILSNRRISEGQSATSIKEFKELQEFEESVWQWERGSRAFYLSPLTFHFSPSHFDRSAANGET